MLFQVKTRVSLKYSVTDGSCSFKYIESSDVIVVTSFRFSYVAVHVKKDEMIAERLDVQIWKTRILI